VAKPSSSGGPRELFGVERLDPLLLSCEDCSAQTCIDRVLKSVADFTEDAPPTDDRTLIAMRCV
jgi:serine phosphatase RsbU (regulator of sigma subunit)